MVDEALTLESRSDCFMLSDLYLVSVHTCSVFGFANEKLFEVVIIVLITVVERL